MPKKTMNFEASLARLEEILQALEGGECELDAMLKLYEEGVGLIRACNERLEKAEQTVKMLSVQPDGGVAMTDFTAGEESLT